MLVKLVSVQTVFFIIFLSAASVFDLKKRVIPDWLNLLIALTALLAFEPRKLLGIITALPFLFAAVVWGGIGGGDIKFIAACGMVLGLPAGLAASVIGLCIMLIYYAAYRSVQKLRKRKVLNAFPLAPFLSAGCIAVYFIT